MPLDTGGLTELDFRAEDAAAPSTPQTLAPTVESGDNIGEALRAIREFKGLRIEDLAADTRVRRAYLAAIEELRLDSLPSRPFTIGYIRAYAQALGCEPEAAVRRFRLDCPDPDQSLRGPVGVDAGRDPRLVLVAVVGAVVFAAILIWNVAQRILAKQAPPPAPVAEATTGTATPAPRGGLVSLGEPLPAPVESTTPAPYETPGLQAAVAARAAAAAGLPAPEAAPPAAGRPNAAPIALPATFAPSGTVYGAQEPGASGVVIQARRAGSLIVKGPGETVHFARYLSAGEAYRVPASPGLVVDIVDTDAFQAFNGGQSRGLLPVGRTAMTKLSQ